MSVAWKNRVEFLTVYVREAHPVNDKQLATATNRRAGILVAEPKTLDERCSLASRCRTTLHLQSTMVVDEIDNRVSTAYAAAPDRLYVIDRQGRVAYQGGPGPFGFNPGEMEQSLLMLMLDERSSDERAPGERASGERLPRVSPPAGAAKGADSVRPSSTKQGQP